MSTDNFSKKTQEPPALLCLSRYSLNPTARYLIIVFSACFLLPAICIAPSLSAGPAHERSAFAASVDPAYSSAAPLPASPVVAGDPWLYGDGEFEAQRLQLLRQRSAAALKNVHFPGVYYQPAARVWFRLVGARLPDALALRTSGAGVLTFDGREVFRFDATVGTNAPVRAVPADLRGRSGVMQVEISTTNGEPPAFVLSGGSVPTSLPGWESSVDAGAQWAPARPIPPVSSGEPPHRVELPTLTLAPTRHDGEVADFGRTMMGRVSFRCAGEPQLWVGESLPEVRENDPNRLEQRTELERVGDGLWRSRHQLALRYIRVTGGAASDLKVDAVYRPARYRGAFACSDERLTRIWMNSAFTLRSCMNELMLDGMKRDRLPWIGDQSVNVIADAYTFADAEIFRRSFTALGRGGIETSDINGIVDYSLWWIISHDRFQRYFADPGYLRREWSRIESAMTVMERHCDAGGFLVPRPKTWLFIDWEFKKNAKLTNVPLQVLWFWSLQSAAALAERAQQPAAAARWRTRSAALATTLHERGWDAAAKGWKLHLDEAGGPLSRHANVLAVLSGLATADQFSDITRHLLGGELPAIVTPFMGTLELTALARLGAHDSLIPRIEACWGRQLDQGATTFWEKFNPAKPGEPYAMYGRPYANSLCHAWASGPAAVLPAEILGIQPIADGWKRFRVAPHLGSLAWAAAAVPAGESTIEVEARREPGGLGLTVVCPPGLGAEVHLPASTELQVNGVVVWSGGRAGKLPPGVRRIDATGGQISVDVDPGHWKFLTTIK